MKTKSIIYVMLTAGLLSLGSCDDKLDIAEHGVLSYDTFYKTDGDAESAVTSIYGTMRGLEYNYKMLLNLLSDDVWAGGGARTDNADLNGVNEFTFDSNQTFIKSCFTSFYQMIYGANVALNHIKGDTDYQKQMLAEAHVLRAWAYFELTSLWGNPPLVDHELASTEYSQPNGKTEELWALVESDLTTAINSGYLTQKSSVSDETNYRVTKQFAQAMLGKAYVWQKKWADAAKVFDEVINSGLYSLYTGSYADILAYNHKNNSESMFESNKVFDANNVFDNGSVYGLMIGWRTDRFVTIESDIYSTGWGFCAPRKSLYDAFVAEEGADGYCLNNTMKTYAQLVQRGNVIASGKTMINEGYFDWKLRVQPGEEPAEGYGFAYTNNVRWMRYAEVLLLAAEANLQAGNQSQADKYYNIVRTRAKLTSKTGVTLEDIIAEKRLELCFECVRYQDLVRWNLGSKYLGDQGKNCPTLDSNGNVTYQSYNAEGKYGYKDRNALLPYPATEIGLNPNIVQNTGW